MGGYVVAKQALAALLKEMHAEVESFGVRVNAVAPDFLDTPLNSDLPQRLIEWGKETRPNNLLVTPKDVADEIYSLINGERRGYMGMSVTVGSNTERKL